MDDRGDIDEPTRQDSGEKFREPKAESRASDNRHAPEYREVIEFFPISPSPVTRPRSPTQEPFDRADQLYDIGVPPEYSVLVGSKGVTV